MNKLLKSFAFWLLLITIGVILILTKVREFFVFWGFTNEESFFLSLMLSMPFVESIVILYKKVNLNLLPFQISPDLLLRPVVSSWAARFFLLFVTLYSVACVYKYLQIADISKTAAIVLLTSLSVYLFVLLLKISTYDKKSQLRIG